VGVTRGHFSSFREVCLKLRPDSGPRHLNVSFVFRKVDVRLPGHGNSNSHGARPVHLIITMIKWIRTSRLSIKKSAASPSSSSYSSLQAPRFIIIDTRCWNRGLFMSGLSYLRWTRPVPRQSPGCKSREHPHRQWIHLTLPQRFSA